MKLVIDIPDEVYKRIKDNKDYDYGELTYAIDNGIPYAKEAVPEKGEETKVLQSLCDTCKKYYECSNSSKISPNCYVTKCCKYKNEEGR